MTWDRLINRNRLRLSNADPNRKGMSDNLDVRNEFESDFGRVVFSSASRRLHDKTQVFPLTTDDNIHSRLTHSMEVMNIGLSFAIYLSECKEFIEHSGMGALQILREINPILKTTCLVHDIGNPPFGHFGEEVYQDYFKCLFESINLEIVGTPSGSSLARNIVCRLSEKQRKDLETFLKDIDFMADYVNFDGNAEGLRVLTKLQYLGDLNGLNLTYATLASSLKYPNSESPQDGLIAKHKHGIFRTEKNVVETVMKECGLVNSDGIYSRHPLAFLMEAADSICYYVMDIEDAISKGWFTSEFVIDELNKSDNVSETTKEKLKTNKQKNGGIDAPTMKDWVMLRTTLLSYLMEVATKNFIKHLPEIEAGEYQEELIEDGDGVYKVLKDISHSKILNNRDVVSLEVTGRAVITGLFDSLLSMLFHSNKRVRKRAKVLMSKSIYKTVLHEHMVEINPNIKGNEINSIYDGHDPDDFSVEERFRLVRDFIACMTDKFALAQYQKISGQKI